MASPHARAMGACCALVRMVEGSMRHKALVRAILQVTGYCRAHVKEAGTITPRANGDFTPAFKAFVEHFLEKLGCGSIFFPEIVPDYEGWGDSWIHGERYKWVRGTPRGEPIEDGGQPIPSDKDRIREAVMLMFENLRDHGTNLDLDDSITLQSCLKDGCCEICGGEDYEDITADKMLFCDNCHVSRHASCYEVKIVPEGTFHCRSCAVNRNRQKARDRTPQSSKKSATSIPLIIDEDRFGTLVGSPHQTRTTRSNPFGGYQQLPGPKAAKSKDTPSPAPRKRSSSSVKNSSGPSKRHVSRGSRAVSHGSALLPAFGESTATSDDTKVAVNLGSRLLTPAPSDARPDVRSPLSDVRYGTPANSVVREPTNSNVARAAADVEEDHRVSMPLTSQQIAGSITSTSSNELEQETPVRRSMPSFERALSGVAKRTGNNEILSAERLDKIELRIRLGPTSLISRSLKLSRISSLDNIFEACINRWKDRLNGEIPRILAYLPKNLEGVTEFTPDFQVSEFLHLIKAEWDNGVEKDLFISMILLRDGEEF
ncbi:hypothetical protein DL98DRAFT_571342 [Cadophora sp. DSE1049]|nr:hypothetical protein DL98DRAFT_571342 [Cadophora sp. DSE1049]